MKRNHTCVLLASCYFCLDMMLGDCAGSGTEIVASSARTVRIAGGGFSFHTQEVVSGQRAARSVYC